MKDGMVPEIRFGKFKGTWTKIRLDKMLKHSRLKNKDLKFDKSQVLSVAAEAGVVNQIEYHGRSYAGVSVAPYGVALHGQMIYTKSPLKAYPFGIIKLNEGKDGVVSTLYAIYSVLPMADGKFLNYYFYHADRVNRYLKPLVNIGAKNDMKVNNEYAISDPVIVPSLPEQQKIATFLTAVDGRLAGLHRQRAALERYKRGVMQGVFGDEVGGEWIDVKAGKVYSFFSTNSLSRANLNYEAGEFRNIHYGDIHTQFSQYLDVRQATVPYITSGIAMKGAAYKHSVQAGDVLLADASEDINDIGKATEVVDAGDIPLYAGLHTIHARPKPGTIAPGFGTLLFQSPAFRRQVSKIAQGAKVLGISPTSIKGIQLRIPPLSEQRRIATFLRALDDRIGLVERQLAGAEAFKRGLLQGMFV